MINRTISYLGTLLVATGIAILIYIGVTYAESVQATPRTHTWNQTQRAAAHRLASRLVGHQTVALPNRLNQHRLTTSATGSEPAIRMAIPKIGVDAPVLQTPPVNGVWEVADWAVGHLTSTPDAGANGNGAYAAHDDIKGEIFKRVDQLAPGDTILLYSRHAVFRYTVINQQTVDPSNVSVLAPTRTPTITLISCAPYWVDTQRLVIQAALKSSVRR